MLDFLRKRKRSWVIFFVIGIIAFVFALYFGSGSLIDDPNLGPVAKVNGETISSIELDNLVMRALRANPSPEPVDELSLRLGLLQDLIQTRLLLQEARRLGLDVTDRELSKTISENPVFQIDGQFNKPRYLRILQANRVTPTQFEQERKNQLLIDKLLDITRDSVHVSEDEVREQFQLEREKINLSFIRLERKDYVLKATVSAEELKAYYDQNQEALKEPSKVRVEYLAYPNARFSAKVEVSDKEIEEYYNLNRDEKFHQAHAVRLRHIYFRLTPEMDPKKKEAVRAKAEQVLGQAQSGKDFAELAKKHSDDFSASSGGDTGFLTRDDILPVLQDTAFGLKKDQISAVLESENGLHILKGVETREEKTKTLKEARDEIIQNIKSERGTRQALQAAEADRAAVLNGAALSSVAKDRGLEAKVTPFFSEEEGLKDVGPVDAFYTTSFALATGQISPVVEGPKAAYIIKLRERKERTLPTLDAIRGDVTRKIKEEKAMKMAQEKADVLLSELKEIKDIRELAKKHNLRVEETGLFHRNSPRIPKIGALNGIPTGGLPLSPRNPIANEAYTGNNTVYLFAFKEKQAVDMKDFEEQKDTLVESVLRARQESALVQFVEGLKAGARIKVETYSFPSG